MTTLSTQSPPRLLLVGSHGKLGQAIRQKLADSQQQWQLTTYHRHSTQTLEQAVESADVIIDVSHANLTYQLIATVAQNPRALLLCTTGWHAATQQHHLQTIADSAAVLIAANTALGSHLQWAIARTLAQYQLPNCQIHITDIHHKQKVDAPSGTALALQQALGDHQSTISSQRIDDVIGTHTISVAFAEESLQISHQVHARAVFASGAIHAAGWLTKQPPGYYQMADVYQTPNQR